MSFASDLSKIFQGTISRAGKASAKRFNIDGQMSLLKGKKSLSDIFIKESNINSYIIKEKETQKESVQTPKQGVRLKLNIKKYYRDYIRKTLNNNLLVNMSPKKGSNSKQKKDNSLNEEKSKNKTIKLQMNYYNKFQKENKKEKDKDINNLSPFYNKIKFKFHNIHLKRLKETNEKNKKKENREPIYKPNLDYIYRKSLSGPEWNIISGRKKNLFAEPGRFLDKFYDVESSSISDLRRTFVNMAKQTKKTTAYYSQDISPKKKLKKITHEKLKSEIKKINNMSAIPKSPTIRGNLNLLKKKFSIKQNKNYSNVSDKKSITPLVKKCISIPDFKRTKGRSFDLKQQDKRMKTSNEGIYYPNYDSIKERTKMMVLYQNNENDKGKNYNDNKFRGLNSVDFFSASDAFEKFKSNVAPKFEKMTSRPYGNNLPTFMQGLFNRLGAELMTDKSLKLNNYSNGGYYNLYKNNLTFPKPHKKEESESSFSFSYDINSCDYEENKVNEVEEQAKTNKIKVEINRIISKMDKLYNNYINAKF